jgi:hypothetical protein
MVPGMRAMYMHNLDPAYGFANGSMGIIGDILLDPREPAFGAVAPGERVLLSFPPLYIIFRPDWTSAAPLERYPMVITR